MKRQYQLSRADTERFDSEGGAFLSIIETSARRGQEWGGSAVMESFYEPTNPAGNT